MSHGDRYSLRTMNFDRYLLRTRNLNLPSFKTSHLDRYLLNANHLDRDFMNTRHLDRNTSSSTGNWNAADHPTSESIRVSLRQTLYSTLQSKVIVFDIQYNAVDTKCPKLRKISIPLIRIDHILAASLFHQVLSSPFLRFPIIQRNHEFYL
jgi:hypothetical protein